MKISKTWLVALSMSVLSACGGGGGGSATGPAVANAAPVANAGPLQNILVASLVALDGSASRDVNGDPLTYRWSLTFKPAGSVAALSSTSSARPTFTADVAGTYVATLIVNDGQIDSTSATVTVTATIANAAPVANAGTAQNVTTSSTVTLDGSGSTDANGDPLTYRWSLTSKPAGSAASLSSITSARPTFTADVAGTYVATLIVNDGQVDSTSATVTVTATRDNAAPVANAGTAQYVTTSSTVTLDGSGSTDANGDPLTYRWSMTSKPSGSAASLSSTSSARPTFTADVAGTYVATLIVNDGQVDSTSATVAVMAINPSMPVVAQGKLYISNWPASSSFAEVDLTTGVLTNQTALTCQGVIAAAVGPDGVAIGTTSDNRVVKFDPVSGRCDAYFSAPEVLDAIAIETDGTIIAQSSATLFGAKQIYRFNFAGGILSKVPLSGVSSIGGLAVGPNGGVYGPGFGGLYQVDTQYGSAAYVGPASQIFLSEVCINSNGSLYGHAFGVLYQYQYSTANLTSQLTMQRDLGLGAIICR